MKFALNWRGTGRCRRRSRRTSRRTSASRASSTTSSSRRSGRACSGIVQGEHALSRLEHTQGEHKDPYDRPDAFVRPYLPGDEVPAAGHEMMELQSKPTEGDKA